MPPRWRLRPPPPPPPPLLLRGRGQAQLPGAQWGFRRVPACFFCSGQLRTSARATGPSERPSLFRRPLTVSAASSAATPTDGLSDKPGAESPRAARARLRDALAAVEQQAGELVNLPRIQLAIRSLEQEPGQESVRVAVVGLARGRASGKAGDSAKELLRLLLADPLKSKQAWEEQLARHDGRQPLMVRVRGGASSGRGSNGGGGGGGDTITLSDSRPVAEIDVSSPLFNGSHLDFLIMESDLAVPAAPAGFEGETDSFGETALVPTLDMGSHRPPVATPVHRALVVADGMSGVAAVAALPLAESPGEIQAAVNLKAYRPEEAEAEGEGGAAPFLIYDAAASAQAIALFRENVANARAYETLWLQSGMPALSHWLKEAALPRADGTTKPAVRDLVASVLRSTLARISEAEAKGGPASATAPASVPPPAFASLDAELSGWAERAHAELQAQLDLAFSGERWQRLGWWKLFWRADDVTMLSSSLVTQQFLPRAEQELVFLAGRIAEAAGAAGGGQYPAPALASATAAATAATTKTRWPTHISFTKTYLLSETVPALQALAQKLVLETAGSSGLATALAVLLHLSSFSVYEAGAVAALGLVASLGRMQRKWEAARQYWQDEVREEGRKAVRAVTASVAAALDRSRDAATGGEARRQMRQELQDARRLVEKAQEAWERLK